MDNKKRILGLDILRITLALIVFMFHSNMHFQCSYSMLNGFVNMGAVAMTGFFMLSGFSLQIGYGGKSITDSFEGLKTFYKKRIYGIFPLYIFVIVCYDLFLSRENVGDRLMLLPIEVTGLQSVFSSLFGVNHSGGTWFVSCIILCYLIYPFLQQVIKILGRGLKPLLFLCFIILLYAPFIQSHFQLMSIYSNPFFRIIEFSIGMILQTIFMGKTALFKTNGSLKSSILLVTSFLLMVGGVSLMYNWGIGRYPKDWMLYNIICMPCWVLIFFSAIHICSNNDILNKICTYLGTISYGFYLAQFFTWPLSGYLLSFVVFDSSFVRISLSLTVCLVLSILMHELVELPLRSLLKRLI